MADLIGGNEIHSRIVNKNTYRKEEKNVQRKIIKSR